MSNPPESEAGPESEIGPTLQPSEPVRRAEDTAQPEEDTAQPEEDTAQPEEDTAQPEEDIAQPEEDTAQPAEDRPQSEEDTSQPEEDTSQSEEDAHPRDELDEEPEYSKKGISTIGDRGKRLWLYPQRVYGKLVKARTLVAWILIIFLMGAPWIEVAGKPAMLFDIPHRRFYFWGIQFFATDTSWLLFLLGAVVFSVFLFTVVFGRIWCGWLCPQTVFLESVIRPIESLIEGPPGHRKKLDGRPMDAGKFFKKTTKYVAYVAVSLTISVAVASLFIGREGVSALSSSPGAHPVAFGFILVLSSLLLFDFAWFREQTCIAVCPYGRLQAVLMDGDSLTILYDYNRGEPRGLPAKAKREKRERNQKINTALARQALPSAQALASLEPNLPSLGLGGGQVEGSIQPEELGDCIDCGKCVQVCPTGIDIRNGIQLECVNCTACIDACDDIMTRVGKPTGLIRYTTENMLKGQPRRIVRLPVILYGMALAAVLIGFGVAVGTRQDSEASLSRPVGAPFVVLPDGRVQNTFELRISNKGREQVTYEVALTEKAQAVAGTEMLTPLGAFTVDPGKVRRFPVLVRRPHSGLRTQPFSIQVKDPQPKGVDLLLETTFLSPLGEEAAKTVKGEGAQE